MINCNPLGVINKKTIKLKFRKITTLRLRSGQARNIDKKSLIAQLLRLFAIVWLMGSHSYVFL